MYKLIISRFDERCILVYKSLLYLSLLCLCCVVLCCVVLCCVVLCCVSHEPACMYAYCDVVIGFCTRSSGSDDEHHREPRGEWCEYLILRELTD
jgi:hypothetical protein